MKKPKTITLRIPSSRPPIFQLGDRLYIDHAFDHGQPLEVLAHDLLAFVERHRGSVVIARPLTPTEAELAKKIRHDSDHETAGSLLHDGRTRWRQQVRRRGP